MSYAPPGQEASWRTVDPLGIVAAHDKLYLLALRDGEERSYRLSRIREAEQLDEPARRPPSVDLVALWRDRSVRFRDGERALEVSVLVSPGSYEQLVKSAVRVGEHTREPDGRWLVAATFQDLRHAEWAVWSQMGEAEAVAPPALREQLGRRARSVAEAYAPASARSLSS